MIQAINAYLGFKLAVYNIYTIMQTANVLIN